jgi:hypothetical protein
VLRWVPGGRRGGGYLEEGAGEGGTLAALHSCSEVGLSTASSACVGLAPRPAAADVVATCRMMLSCWTRPAGSTATALGHPYVSAIPAAPAHPVSHLVVSWRVWVLHQSADTHFTDRASHPLLRSRDPNLGRQS